MRKTIFIFTAVLTFCFSGSAQTAYITNNGTNTISVINVTTGTVTTTITVGNNPYGASISTDGSKTYITNLSDNTVSVINNASNTVTVTIPVGTTPISICVNPDGSKVYVANWNDNTVSVISTATNTVTATITGFNEPGGEVVSPDGSKVYVANQGAGTVSVIDAPSNTITATITVGSSPWGLTITPDGSKIYVANNSDGNVGVIKTSDNSIITTITVGNNPSGVSANPDGNNVYVTNQSDNTVSVINTSDNTVTTTVPVGAYPEGISLSPDGSKIYVANRDDNDVSVIDAASNSVTGTIAVGAGPKAFGNFISIYSGEDTWTGAINTDWNTAGNWSADVVPTSGYNVTIPNVTNDPIVNQIMGSPATCHNLTINNSGSLTINAGKAITVSGNITNDGTLTIKSDASNIGSLLNSGTITVSGTFNIERYLSTNGSSRWEYVSSPVVLASSSLFTSASHALYYADEANNAWVSILNASPQNMTILKGYTRKYVNGQGDGDAVKTFTGVLNTGSQSIGLTRTESAPGAQHGWNLVGNPYPSSMDWNASSGWTKTNIDNAIYFRTNGNYGSYISGVGTNGGTQYIPPMQAFWVRVSSGNTIGTLACNNNVRVHNNHNIYKTTSLDNTLHLTATNNANGLTDDTYIRFNQDATDDFDSQYDAYKMFAADSAYPQVYTNNSTDDISINSLSELTGERTVPLGFKTSISGQFTLTADMVSSFIDNGNTVYLEDIQNGIFKDLSVNNTYQFTSGITTGLTRFVLHFNPTITNITENVETGIEIFSSNNEVHISSMEMLDGDVAVYDMLGQVVASRHLSGSTSCIFNMESKCAVYIVKYTTSDQTLTRKIFINQ